MMLVLLLFFPVIVAITPPGFYFTRRTHLHVCMHPRTPIHIYATMYAACHEAVQAYMTIGRCTHTTSACSRCLPARVQWATPLLRRGVLACCTCIEHAVSSLCSLFPPPVAHARPSAHSFPLLSPPLLPLCSSQPVPRPSFLHPSFPSAPPSSRLLSPPPFPALPPSSPLHSLPLPALSPVLTSTPLH